MPVKIPMPIPLEVWLLVISGVGLVSLQQMPRAVTGAPPSAVIFPPAVPMPGSAAETEGTDVVSVAVFLVIKLTWAP